MVLLRTILTTAIAAHLALAAAEARADEGTAAPSVEYKGENFWIADDPEAENFQAKMADADRLALLATHYKTTPLRRARIAAEAMRAYAEAIEINPNSAEAHFRAAVVSGANQTKENFPRPSDIDIAIAHLEAFEQLAPNDPRLANALFQRSLLRTKRRGKRNIELGIEDYDKQLALIDQTGEANRNTMSTTLSNRAELLMMLGRLEESIAGYEAAIDFEDGISYGYGLAVALDRDGQGFRARAVARRYALLDPSDALTRNGTFFVPAGEIHYYQALRAESLANYRQAATAYLLFLQRVPRSPFVARARENLKAIQGKAASQPAPRRSRLPSVKTFMRPRRAGGSPI